MAPTIAVSRMLERARLKLQDFDFYEIHEAFAAQVLATLKAFEDPAYCKTYLGRDAPLGAIDRAKMNVKGSSLAFGHPFAATGARIIGNLAKLLSEHGGRGLISVCTAGGMGVAAIMESRKAAEMRHGGLRTQGARAIRGRVPRPVSRRWGSISGRGGHRRIRRVLRVSLTMQSSPPLARPRPCRAISSPREPLRRGGRPAARAGRRRVS